jgi:hypothetical protein
MNVRVGFAAVAFVLGLACARPAAAAESVLYRVFLFDGTTLVSYGEFARVADRVVLSIPLGETTDSPDLQLVSVPEASVDWERTEQYSNAVRAQRYGETRGEEDFALLGGRVTEALNLIALTPDPARRLAMAQEARGNLARRLICEARWSRRLPRRPSRPSRPSVCRCFAPLRGSCGSRRGGVAGRPRCTRAPRRILPRRRGSTSPIAICLYPRLHRR